MAVRQLLLLLDPLLLLSLLLCSAVTAASTDSCPAEAVQPLITGSRFRVHEQFFSSSPFSSEVEDARLESSIFTSIWCTEPTEASSPPWLQVEFGYDVTIERIQTEGFNGIGGFDFYVTRFQVFVGSNSTDLEPLSMQPNASAPMVFERTSPDIEFTELPYPVSTRVLRIVALSSYPDNTDFCLDLEAWGCLTQPSCDSESQLSREDSELLGLITASSADDDDPAEDVVDSGSRAWCSIEPFMASSPAPYIQLNFTTAISVTYMRARGGVRGFSYVTGFRLEILDQFGEFVPYGVTDEPTVFTTNSSREMLYTLWRPAIGRVFRFNIIDGVRNTLLGFSNNFCWNIELYGCLSNGSALVLPPLETTTAATEDSETTADSNTEPVSTDDTGPQATTRSPSRFVAVYAGVTATLIAIIIAFVIIMCVILFVCCSERKPPETPDEETLSSNISPYHKYDNAIYGEEITSPALSDEVKTDSKSDPENQSNTYESLSHSFAEGLAPADQQLEYAYVDRETVQARVTSGFEVKADMKKNKAYNVNSSVNVEEDSSEWGALDSMEDNLLYGGN